MLNEPVTCHGFIFRIQPIGLFSLQYFGIGGYIFGHPYVAANDSIVPDGDAAEDGAVAVYDDIVLEDGVAVDALDGVALCIQWETLGPESNTLVEFHVIAYDAGGSDDHSCAMVDGEMAADGSGRMYVDACLAMGHLGDDTWDKGYTQ